MVFKNKKVTVVGLGKSGFAAAKFLHEKKALVRVTESSEKKEALENASYLRALGIEVETGVHTEPFIAGSACVVTSPGVPRAAMPLEWARRRKIPIISEIELASQFCPGRIVAVTGSNGKTTTCHLIHRVLMDAGKDSVLCGNVGFSFLDALPRIGPKTVVVLELSSFQLEDSPTLRPDIAVVLNIHANHLDRHGDISSYARAKENIFVNQKEGDTLILNADSPLVREMADRSPTRPLFFSLEELGNGVTLRGDEVVYRSAGKDRVLFHPRKCRLKGEHNIGNMMACAAVAMKLRVPVKKLRKTLEGFNTLEHRIEPLGEIKGVRFVNDSKSTTVDSTRMAIRSVEGRVVLLAGGRDKGMPFGELLPLLKERLRAAVLYGEARERIAGVWKELDKVRAEKDFKDAFKAAFEEAKAGDTVLLSPMCTSFDQFSSFEQRGQAFRHLFEELQRAQ